MALRQSRLLLYRLSVSSLLHYFKIPMKIEPPKEGEIKSTVFTRRSAPDTDEKKCIQLCRLRICMPHTTFYSLGAGLSKTTRLTQDPTPSSATSTRSPSFSHSAGFRPMPTPWGLCVRISTARCRPWDCTYVPVKIRSPGKRVVPCDKNAIVLATPKIISLVEEDWRV